MAEPIRTHTQAQESVVMAGVFLKFNDAIKLLKQADTEDVTLTPEHAQSILKMFEILARPPAQTATTG